MRFSASAKVGVSRDDGRMIPNDCCAGILFYIRQLATVARFDVSFFFYLASISFEKERIYGASEF